jgi:hypothetical protein
LIPYGVLLHILHDSPFHLELFKWLDIFDHLFLIVVVLKVGVSIVVIVFLIRLYFCLVHYVLQGSAWISSWFWSASLGFWFVCWTCNIFLLMYANRFLLGLMTYWYIKLHGCFSPCIIPWTFTGWYLLCILSKAELEYLSVCLSVIDSFSGNDAYKRYLTRQQRVLCSFSSCMYLSLASCLNLILFKWYSQWNCWQRQGLTMLSFGVLLYWWGISLSTWHPFFLIDLILLVPSLLDSWLLIVAVHWNRYTPGYVLRFYPVISAVPKCANLLETLFYHMFDKYVTFCWSHCHHCERMGGL